MTLACSGAAARHPCLEVKAFDASGSRCRVSFDSRNEWCRAPRCVHRKHLGLGACAAHVGAQPLQRAGGAVAVGPSLPLPGQCAHRAAQCSPTQADPSPESAQPRPTETETYIPSRPETLKALSVGLSFLSSVSDSMSAPFLPPFCTVRPPVGTKFSVLLAPDIYRHLNRQIRLAFITWCCTTMDDNSLISKEIQPHRRMSLDGAGQL